MEDVIFTIDLKAFYASVECIDRGLDPFTTPLVVTDISRKESTIVLSVTPYLKNLGVPSRCRRKELPDIPNMIYATPRMQRYIDKSTEIISIFLDYVGLDDLHIYSIDEVFINITPYLKLYKLSPIDLAKKILDDIKNKTGLTATCGIGPNMFLAKIAGDTEAKKSDNFIAKWGYEDVKTKLWKITPLNKVWGIAAGYEARLAKLGIFNLEQLAHIDIKILEKEFGVIGLELYDHAWGKDDAKIRDKYRPISKNLALGQVLMRDFLYNEGPTILLEMCDDLTYRLRAANLKTLQVSLTCIYSSRNGGFSHQTQLLQPTDNPNDIYKSLIYLYEKYFDKSKKLRQIHISFSKLVEESYEQLDLFNTNDNETALYKVLDKLQKLYGKNSVLRTTSLLKSSTIKERHNQIGGHRK